MTRIQQWEIIPHPVHGHMCLRGVIRVHSAKPGDCGPMVDATIRTSRIVGFGACSEGITVRTVGSTYLLVGMSKPDMIERAAMTGRTDSSEVNWDRAEKDDEELAEAMGDDCFL